jgi:hypothetical protein
MYDASNRKHIREAEKLAARIEKDRIEFLQASLNTVQGRTWFYHYLEDHHLFSDPFTGDPYREAYIKGERNSGLRIFAELIQHCPDQYLIMIKESNARDQLYATRTEHAGSPDPGRDLEGRSAAGDSASGPSADYDPYEQPQ